MIKRSFDMELSWNTCCLKWDVFRQYIRIDYGPPWEVLLPHAYALRYYETRPSLSAFNHSLFPLESLLDDGSLQANTGKNFGNSCTLDHSTGGVGQISVKEGKLLALDRLPRMWCDEENSFYTAEWAVGGAGQISAFRLHKQDLVSILRRQSGL